MFSTVFRFFAGGPIVKGLSYFLCAVFLFALSMRLMNGTGNEVVGLLAEAKRLAPDDPSVAYWCASTLVDAGYGKAANEVFTPRREAIAKAYPGLADQLAA